MLSARMLSAPRLIMCWQASGSTRRPRRAEIKCFAGGAAVKFVIPYHCRFGQHLCLVGSVEQLGQWDVAHGLEMHWSDGDVWRVEVDIPHSGPPGTESQVEYKYVVRNGDRATASAWTPGANYILKLPSGPNGAGPNGVRLHVRDSWDGTAHKVKVHLPGAPAEDEEGEDSQAVPSAAAAAPPAVAAAAAVAPPRPPPAVIASVLPPPLPLAFAAPPQPAPTAAPPAPPSSAAPPAPPTVERPSLQSPVAQPELDMSSKRRGRRRTRAAPQLESGSDTVNSGNDDSEDAVLAAITRESERAMQQLDAAISSSWELLEGAEVDPADPTLLAADRRLAAASQRAAAMYKALDAAAAQRLLPDGGSGGLGGKAPREGQ